eukprot:80028_1
MNFVQFPFDDHVEFGDQLILQITYPLFSLLATASFAQSIKSYPSEFGSVSLHLHVRINGNLMYRYILDINNGQMDDHQTMIDYCRHHPTVENHTLPAGCDYLS